MKETIKEIKPDNNHGQTTDMPMLNDEEIEKILQPTELFPDEIITPSNNDSNTPSNIETIDGTINNNNNTSTNIENEPLYNKSITLRNEPMTDLVRHNNRMLGIYNNNNNQQQQQQSEQQPPRQELHSMNIINGRLSNDLPPTHSTANQSRMEQAIHQTTRAPSMTETMYGSMTTQQQHQQSSKPSQPQPHKTRPAFVNKLWSMLNDETNEHLIQWSYDGQSFIVTRREEFVHEVLPRYFKHSNFASFVRQLNMYGWHKVQDVKAGSIQNSSDDRWQFENPNFIRGREDLLINIMRQKGNSANQHHNNNNNNGNGNFNFNEGNEFNRLMTGMENNHNNNNNNNNKPILHLMNEPSTYSGMDVKKDVSTVLNELETIKYNQIAISKDLLRINKDNELLWKENMVARDRHRTQQQTLEKIFRFLTSMVPHMDQKMLMDGIMNFTDTNGGSNNNNPNNNDNNNSNNSNNDNNSNNNVNPIDKNTTFDNNGTNNSNRFSNGYTDFNDGGNSRFHEDVFDEVIDNTKKNAKDGNNTNNNITNIDLNDHNSYYMGNTNRRNPAFDSPSTQIYNEFNTANNNNNNTSNEGIQDNNTYSNFQTYNSYNPYDYIARPSQKARLLLKNRSNSSSSTNVPTISPDNLNRDSKISELPLDDDDEEEEEDDTEPATNPPTMSAKDDNDEDNNIKSDDPDMASTKFLGNIQSNIDEQDLRIQHLEDMVKGLSPIKDKQDNGSGFSLQDYFTSDVLPETHTTATTASISHPTQESQGEGLTPLFYDDNTLLHVGEASLPTDTAPTNSVDNIRSSNRKRKSIDNNNDNKSNDAKIEELSPEPNLKRSKFV